jgi:hypothetical protein
MEDRTLLGSLMKLLNLKFADLHSRKLEAGLVVLPTLSSIRYAPVSAPVLSKTGVCAALCGDRRAISGEVRRLS